MVGCLYESFCDTQFMKTHGNHVNFTLYGGNFGKVTGCLWPDLEHGYVEFSSVLIFIDCSSYFNFFLTNIEWNIWCKHFIQRSLNPSFPLTQWKVSARVFVTIARVNFIKQSHPLIYKNKFRMMRWSKTL